jgi:hypothetical protein
MNHGRPHTMSQSKLPKVGLAERGIDITIIVVPAG